MHYYFTSRLGACAALLLLVCSGGQAQQIVHMAAPVAGPSAAQLRQLAFQVTVGLEHQQQLLEQLRTAFPLTYYDSEWREGTVKLATGQELRGPMRYNFVARALELHRPGPPAKPDSVLVLRQFQTLELAASQSTLHASFVVHPCQSLQAERGYNLFEKVTAAPGPVQLLLLHELLTQAPPVVTSPGGTGRPRGVTLERVTRLYARVPQRALAQEIEFNKPAVLHLFGRDSRRMADYAAAHQLSFDNLSHVVQLVDEYNRTARP